jgi:uncharacterized protein YndB with AHSA1/START domain
MSEREPLLERIIDAPPEKFLRAWAEPELLEQCFTPQLATLAAML